MSLPSDFFGRILFILQKYGVSFLNGAGKTMAIALVGTLIGCIIGFAVGIVQTIPVDKKDNPVKRGVLGLLKYLRGGIPRNSHDGSGHVYLLWIFRSVWI